MLERTDYSNWIFEHLPSIRQCLWKDRAPIVLVTVIVAALAAVMGKMTNTTRSTAQLVLTPLPLRTAATAGTNSNFDAMARMIAGPLDVKTASLLCMSDDVLQKTREKLNGESKLSGEIKNLHQFRNSLDFRITITKETPYEIAYSPVLELTAEASTPADAKLIVNTWAKMCVKAAEEIQEKQQGPSNEAFRSRADAAREAVQTAEHELEQFWKKNNITYMQNRLARLVTLVSDFEELRATTEQNVMAKRASANALAADKLVEKPTVTLKWTPSERLLSALAAKAGTTLPQEQDGGKEALDVEQINETYVTVSTQLALDKAGEAGFTAQLERLDADIVAMRQEMEELQVQLATVQTTENRLKRNIEILETAYKDVAEKGEYAQVAQALKHPSLQLLSEGAEWELPRFRRAIYFGFGAGVLGFLLASCCSIVVRLVLKPAFES